MIIVISFLILLIYADIFLLRRQDQEIFNEIFCLRKWMGPALLTFIIFIFALTLENKRLLILPGVLILCPFPFYLGKRRNFKKFWQDKNKGVDFYGDKVLLASQTLGTILHWLAGMFVLVVGIKIVARLWPLLRADMAQMVFISLGSSMWMLLLIGLFVKGIPGGNFAYILGLKRQGRSWFHVFVIPILAGLLLAGLCAAFTVSRSYQPQTPFYDLIANTTSSWLMLAFFIVAIIVAPFFEEVIFRGFFFSVIERLKGKYFAVISIAVIFSLLHYDQYWGDWMAIAAVTFLGFLLTLLRAWTGTSIASMMTHYSFNIGMTFIPLFLVYVSNPVYFEYQMRYNDLNSQQKEMFLLESMRKYPNHAASYNDLAWTYAEDGVHLDQALVYVDQALAIEPDNFAFLDTKAEVMYKKGDLPAAIMIAEYLKQQYPSNEYIESQLEKFREALNQKGSFISSD